MRKHLATLLATLASIIFAGAEARAVDIYVLTNNSSGPFANDTDFGRIDSATGAYTSIANISDNVWNLAWNPTAGNFFTTADISGFSSTSTLRTLTTTGTLSSSLATVNAQLYGMAYRTSNSTMYGYNRFSADTGTLNTANGTWTILNANPGVLSDDPSGGRYSIMNDTMYFAVNATTDGIGTMGYTATSTYQQIAANPIYAGMVLANDGTTMYGIVGNGTAGQQRLYTIDVNTGVATAGAFITGTGLGTFFHGAGIVPVPVPEPSTYALGAIASGVMAYIARRRKARRA